jgi:hypothetical protein
MAVWTLSLQALHDPRATPDSTTSRPVSQEDRISKDDGLILIAYVGMECIVPFVRDFYPSQEISGLISSRMIDACIASPTRLHTSVTLAAR